MKRVLIGCESSGVVREAFRRRGFDAWSCDLLPADDGSPHHFQMDLLELLASTMGQWHLLIAHPPCTHLAGSGARWLTDHWVKKKSAPGGRYWHDGGEKRALQEASVAFVETIWAAQVPRIAIENPVGMLSTLWMKPTQIIQPFHFGDPFRKGTCLWLKNLPPLAKTNDLGNGEQKCWKEPPSPNRWKVRSKTYQGIADAMAEQWGSAVDSGRAN